MSRKHGGRRWKPEQFLKASRNQQRAILAKLREQGKLRTKSGKVRKMTAIERAVKEKKAKRPLPEWMKKRTEKLLGESKKAFALWNKTAREKAERKPWNPAAIGKVTEHEDEEERLSSSGRWQHKIGKMVKRKRKTVEAGEYEKQQKASMDELRKKLELKGLKFDPWHTEEENRAELEKAKLKIDELEGRAARKFTRLMQKSNPFSALINKKEDKFQSDWDKFLLKLSGKSLEENRLLPSELALQKKLAESPMVTQQDIAKKLKNLNEISQIEYPPTKTEEFEKQGFFVIPPVRKRTGSDITGLEKRQYLNLYGPDRLLVTTKLPSAEKYLLGIPLTKAWTKTTDVETPAQMAKAFAKHEDRIYQEILERYKKGGRQLSKSDLASLKESESRVYGEESKIQTPRQKVENLILALRYKYGPSTERNPQGKGLLERFDENVWEETARLPKAFSWSKPSRAAYETDEEFLRRVREIGNPPEQERNLQTLRLLYGSAHPDVAAWLKEKYAKSKPDILMWRKYIQQLNKQKTSVLKERAKGETELAKKILVIKRKKYKGDLTKHEVYAGLAC